MTDGHADHTDQRSSSSAAARAATRPRWSPPSSAREVTVVDTDGLGGSAVLTDCVPSKTLIATAELMTDVAGRGRARRRAARPRGRRRDRAATSTWPGSTRGSSSWPPTSPPTSAAGWTKEGVDVVRGRGRLDGPGRVVVDLADGGEQMLEADAVLVATGAAPRTLPTAQPDGERILTWEQVYDLDEVPTELIVVGSGVTGAEFASAYLALGIDGHPGLQPRPGAARRGRRRRRRARGRAHPPRHERAVAAPGWSR